MRMSHSNRLLMLCCAFAFTLCAIAAPCLAADDSARFVGTWQTRFPVNGQIYNMISVNTASDTQVFVATPNGKALVKHATFTAKDGQYQEIATLGAAAACQYQFLDDNHLQMSNALGAVVWVRSPQTAPPAPSRVASPGAPVTPTATPAATPTPPAAPPAAPVTPPAPTPPPVPVPAPSGAAATPVSTAVSSDAAPTGKPNIPWTTPADAANYAVDGTDLWNIATHTLVAKDWDNPDRDKHATTLVLDRPDLMLCGDQTRDENGFGVMWHQLSSPGTQLVKTTGGVGPGLAPMISSDLRRVVWIDKGDIWRGDVDWNNSAIINRKQVTNLGVFSIPPIYWCDNFLFFASAQRTDKTIVRVDLLSGTFVQFEGRSFFNGRVAPNGDLLGAGRDANGQHNGSWAVLNPRSLKVGSIPAGLTIGKPRIPNEQSFKNSWLDRDNVLFTDGHRLLSVNFDSGAATPVGICDVHNSLLNEVLPGGQAVEINHMFGAAHAMQHSQTRVVQNLKNGKETQMNYGADDFGIWIDGDHFIYGQSTGDLTKLGMYLFTASTGQTTRLCQRPADLSPAPVYFPKLNTLVFHSSAGGGNGSYCSVKLDGQDMTVLAMKSVRPINANPLDLGMGSSSKPTWQPIQYTPEQMAVPNG